MLYRLKKILKKWNDSHTESSSEDVDYVTEWVTSLADVLHRNKSDKQFCSDLLFSAAEFYRNKFDDQQKTDAFIFLLGARNRKR